MNDNYEEPISQLVRIALQRLEGLHRAGVNTLPRPAPQLSPLTPPPATAALAPMSRAPVSSRFQLTPTNTPVARASGESSSTPVRPPLPESQNQEDVSMPRKKAKSATESLPAIPLTEFGPPLKPSERGQALQALSCEVATCQLCPALVRNRTQTVFGVGNVKPRVVFFGEAPGADEDRQGEPFVGRAGQLLTKIIEASTFRREDVYILNVLKCRPPDNRAPEDDEIENCRHFFEKQLEILRPDYIVCVGVIPMKALLRTKKGIGQMRGAFHDWQGVKVVVTYHPAYLLRNPDAKKFVWDDMKMLMADMGIEIPKKTP